MAKLNTKDLEFEQALVDRATESIEQLDVNQKMRTSFLNYAMSVIVSRALPDARDGLKPVQRRILYGMNELKIFSNVQHKKSARIVGDVMGKYHPHGDSSIYEAMVRMAQDFSYRYMLVDGHGNFGNIDGDGAAAMRYTEARLSKISMEMLRDIDKDTVNFIDNYDATEKEPELLPSRFPNLLVNGSMGIAVGMATNIPPHNLGEVIDGCVALLHNPSLTSEDLMEFVKGPDFPTGAQILGAEGLKDAYTKGNGSIVIRSKSHMDTLDNGTVEIIFTEIPYGINKTRIIERMALVSTPTKNDPALIPGVSEIRDESSMDGIKIVVEVKQGFNPDVILNMLYKYTPLQTSYGMNMVCLVDNKPVNITLHDAIDVYLKHQLNVITRRTEYDLRKAMDRIHILEGLLVAQNNIDEVVHIIRNTKDGTEKDKLMARFSLDDIQAQAILDMRLQRISGLNYQKLVDEKNELDQLCVELKEILSSEGRKIDVLTQELNEIKAKYADPRKSELCLNMSTDIDNEDLIPREECVITVTELGYLKRMNQDEYKAQSRGGVGVRGMKTHNDDQISKTVPTNSHNVLLFFTTFGRVYSLKAYKVPESSKQSKGLAIVNLLNLQEGEKLATITSVESLEDTEKFLVFITKNGTIKRTSFNEFQNIRTNGIIAISLVEGDELQNVLIADDNSNIILGSSNGKSIRFDLKDVRPTGRNAIGVKGMEMASEDYVIGSAVINSDEEEILVLTDKGFGKRTTAGEYRVQKRGGMGCKTLNSTDKNGSLCALTTVQENQDILITTNKGVVIRTDISEIRQTGRNTIGVKVINLKDNQTVSSFAIIEHAQVEESEEVAEAVEKTQE